MDESELREKLAAAVHASWSDWTEWVLTCSRRKTYVPGQIEHIIPQAYVEGWQRQITTPYDQLTEAEKELDRKEVDKLLSIILEYVDDCIKQVGTCADGT